MSEAKTSLTDQVYDKLFDMLVRGEYTSGKKLPPEQALANQFGVSRNTVRTALNRLNALDVVETRRGDATYVKGIGTKVYMDTIVPSVLVNANNLMGLMEFRRGVEVASARHAAINATEEDLRGLEEYFEHLQQNNISNVDFAEATSDFHLRIAIASKNEMFAQMLRMIKWVITSRMADFLVYKPNVADSSYYHYMIFQCIKQRKPEEAAYMMERHMNLLIERVEDYIRNYQDESEAASAEAHRDKKVTNIFRKEL